jgi:hydrogenase maturation factor
MAVLLHIGFAAAVLDRRQAWRTRQRSAQPSNVR